MKSCTLDEALSRGLTAMQGQDAPATRSRSSGERLVLATGVGRAGLPAQRQDHGQDAHGTHGQDARATGRWHIPGSVRRTGRGGVLECGVVLSAMLAMVLLVTLSGCAPKPPQTLLSRREVVDSYNANAQKAPRLWARARIALSLRDQKGRPIWWGSTSPLASPNGRLLLAKDAAGVSDFVLIGSELGSEELFRLGVGPGQVADGADVYYLWYQFGDYGQAHWGLRWLAGAEGIESLPLDPVQLLGVLGVSELPADFTQLPTVAVTMQQEPPFAYVLTYVDRQALSGEVLFRRRLYLRWSDKEPPRPFRMDLLDNSGRTVMVAHMSDYELIAVPDLAAGQAPPTMPTRFDIRWPEQNSRIRIVLSEMTTEDKWDVAALNYTPPPVPAEQVDLPLLSDLLRRQGEQP